MSGVFEWMMSRRLRPIGNGIVAAGHQSSPDSRRALESLCGAYSAERVIVDAPEKRLVRQLATACSHYMTADLPKAWTTNHRCAS